MFLWRPSKDFSPTTLLYRNYKMYKIFFDYLKQQQTYVIKLSTNEFIPLDPNNIDYQEYLAWLAQGNQPEPPDE